jgi:hypothetical protein
MTENTTTPEAPTTDEVRDIWVDWNLNPLPREQGVALVKRRRLACWWSGHRIDRTTRPELAVGEVRVWDATCQRCGASVPTIVARYREDR